MVKDTSIYSLRIYILSMIELETQNVEERQLDNFLTPFEGEKVFLLNPTFDVLAEIYDDGIPDSTQLNVLLTGLTLSDINKDLYQAMIVSSLESNDSVFFRLVRNSNNQDNYIDIPSKNTFISDTQFGVVVSFGVEGVTVFYGESSEDKMESLFSLWGDAEQNVLKYPPMDYIEQTLEEISEGMFDDFMTALEYTFMEQELNRYHALVATGAIHNILVHDIREWIDETNFGTPSAISRMKRQIEDETTELLDTDLVPVDVGRPRHRLVLHFESDVDSVIDFLEEYQNHIE